MMDDDDAQLADVRCRAKKYVDLASQAKGLVERERYERIVELYLKIAGELEIISDRRKTEH